MPDVEKVVPADDMDLLNQEDEETVVTDEEEGKDEDTKDDEEDKEDLEGEDKEEKEVEGEEEEKEIVEDDLGPRRPSFKEVRAKYPKFFKDFPDLREAFFRETKYTEVFPTVEDAKEAFEDLTTLSTLRDKVLEGDFSVILESVKEADDSSYKRLVRGMLPALYKQDQDAFMQAITPSIENMLRSAYRDGKSNGNEDLENSAMHLSKWFFETEDVATGKTTTVKKDDEPTAAEKKLDKERKDYETRKYHDAYKDVISTRDTVMERAILKDLDPDDELSLYVRNKLVVDIIGEVDRALAKDTSHVSLMTAKWRRAKVEGYSKDSLRDIVSAYQARAKSLVPSVRSKLKAAALGKAVDKKSASRAKEVAEHKEVPAGKVSGTIRHLPRPSEIDWRQTSDADILAGNIKTIRR